MCSQVSNYENVNESDEANSFSGFDLGGGGGGGVSFDLGGGGVGGVSFGSEFGDESFSFLNLDEYERFQDRIDHTINDMQEHMDGSPLKNPTTPSFNSTVENAFKKPPTPKKKIPVKKSMGAKSKKPMGGATKVKKRNKTTNTYSSSNVAGSSGKKHSTKEAEDEQPLYTEFCRLFDKTESESGFNQFCINLASMREELGRDFTIDDIGHSIHLYADLSKEQYAEMTSTGKK